PAGCLRSRAVRGPAASSRRRADRRDACRASPRRLARGRAPDGTRHQPAQGLLGDRQDEIARRRRGDASTKVPEKSSRRRRETGRKPDHSSAGVRFPRTPAPLCRTGLLLLLDALLERLQILRELLLRLRALLARGLGTQACLLRGDVGPGVQDRGLLLGELRPFRAAIDRGVPQLRTTLAGDV